MGESHPRVGFGYAARRAPRWGPHYEKTASKEGSTSRERQAAFAGLSKMILDDQPLDVILLRVAQSAQHTIKQAHDVSVTMMDADQATTVVFTGALAIHLDQVQYELGSGPCLEAARAGTTLVVAHDQADSPNPEFPGMRATAACPYGVGGAPGSGSVPGQNIYIRADDAPDDESVQLAQAFAPMPVWPSPTRPFPRLGRAGPASDSDQGSNRH